MIEENIENKKKFEKGSLGWIKELGERHGIYCEGFVVKDVKKELEKRGILKDISSIENSKVTAKNKGFDSIREYDRERTREWRHDTGRNLPISENPECERYFGEFIAENYVMKTFEDPSPALPNNPWYDWTCKKGEKIQHKARCLSHFKGKSSHWNFIYIRYNIIPNYDDLADYFIFSGWDDRDSLNPLHVWIFHKDDIVRGRPIWMGNSLAITNTPECLKEFEKYEVTNRLNKLKEICGKL